MKLWIGALGALAGTGVFGVAIAACSSPLGPTCGVDFNCADDAAADGVAADGMTGDGAGDANGDQSTTDGGGDGPSDAPMETTVSCDASTAITCNGQCVDSTQPAHCGSCTNVCTAPTHGQATCTAPSTCGITCDATYHACNGNCLPDSNEPSMDACVVSDALGVFVAPTGSDTTGCGTKALPCQTIGKGLAVAKVAGKRTYVCEGTYNEQLVVDATLDGAKVFGGFACGTWTYDANRKPKVLLSAGGYAMVVSTPTSALFEDFAFEAKSAMTAGESSIAVFAKSAMGVVLRRCNVTAGAGVAGQDRTQGSPYASAAPNGVNGTAVGGGTLVVNPACTLSTSGVGGGPAVSGQDGTDGAPGSSNKGTMVACQSTGLGGGPGAGGTSGADGAGASTWATFNSSGWSPSWGSSGGYGVVGQGGGGGASVDLSGGGGSGGAGGCGGAGGSAGTGGGSSITLLAFSSSVDVEMCTLTSNNGGRGGNGATGQVGQTGGTKGNGFANACQAGKGGNGGSGGTGGGGSGGLSAGVVWLGTAPTVNGTATPSAATLSGVTIGALGAGGTGATTGKAGVAAAVVQFQ